MPACIKDSKRDISSNTCLDTGKRCPNSSYSINTPCEIEYYLRCQREDTR